MKKMKSLWTCSDCGHVERKWYGQCVQCEGWNSFIESLEEPSSQKRYEGSAFSSKPCLIEDVNLEETPRLQTKIQEFDRLLGGGIVPGSLVLVGGDPGIGKSTLLLQASNKIAMQGRIVLYVSGEESIAQTSMRARRLGVSSSTLYLLCETNVALIKEHIEKLKPEVVIIDSIQIVYRAEISSAPGSVSQVREAANEFMHLAKGQGISIFLIGHVTKSGEIAGPRVLEHLVDTVLYFEGDKHHQFRMLRAIKNRFGATDEVALFQMESQGLVEVQNPSLLLLEERMKGKHGSVVIPTLEGTRPLLIEIQALVTETFFSTPSRKSTGIDPNRLALLLAVLEKRVGYQLYRRDVFVSVAGGLKVTEPAIDLGVLLAIASSTSNKVIDPESVALGEVGLGGEIRSVSRVESRLKEAIHLGFRRALIPKKNLAQVSEEIKKKIELVGIEVVDDALEGFGI